MSETVELLRGGMRLLETGGWIQGALRNNNGRCALGALDDACERKDLQDRERFRAERLLEDAIPTGPKAVGLYNDAKGRTREQVLALYAAAIQLAEQRGV